MTSRARATAHLAAGALAWLVVALSGCATSRLVSLSPPSSRPSAGDYITQLKRWTRHGQLLHDFDIALDVYATLRAPEFREAFAAKYIAVYHVAPESRERIRSELLAQGADRFQFHVATAAHEWSNADLASARTPWRITLLDDQQHELLPTSIVAAKERGPHDSAFFPYTDLFSRSWEIGFPLTRADGAPLVGPHTKALILRFASPQGAIDLVWRLQ